MEYFILYLAKASIGIVLFYIIYWVFLRKETFYNINRILLISSLILAVLIPLFPLHYSVLLDSVVSGEIKVVSIIDSYNNIPLFRNDEEVGTSFIVINIVALLYFTGVSILTFRLLIQSFVLTKIIRRASVEENQGIRIVYNDKYEIPFSYFNFIFINSEYYSQEDLPEILAHERVHIQEKHWVDLLIIELLTVVFWFNPFVWFFERSIKQNHEYLADIGVLAQGYDIGRYQTLLINQLMGVHIVGITNNLNFALNKNRLKMMTKKKTSGFARLKLVLTLPIVAFLLFAFAQPEVRYINTDKLDNNIIVDNNQNEYLVKIEGFVTDEKEGPLAGVSIIIVGTTKGTVSDIDGKFALEAPYGSIVELQYVGKSRSRFTVEPNEIVTDKFSIGVVLKTIVLPIYNRTFSGEQMANPPVATKQTYLNKEEAKEENIDNSGASPEATESAIFRRVYTNAKYQGGYEEMMVYIEEMQYEMASNKNIKGKATVNFTINTKGAVIEIKVVEKENEGVAKGAYIIVSKMPKWSPAKQRGKPVNVKYLLPIEFK